MNSRSSCSDHKLQHHSSPVLLLHLACLTLELLFPTPKQLRPPSTPSPPPLPGPATISSCPGGYKSFLASLLASLLTEQSEMSLPCLEQPSAPRSSGKGVRLLSWASPSLQSRSCPSSQPCAVTTQAHSVPGLPEASSRFGTLAADVAPAWDTLLPAMLP